MQCTTVRRSILFKNSFRFRRNSISTRPTVLYTWGIGTEGQLGHQTFDVKTGFLESAYVQESPRRLVKSKKYKSVSCGGSFTLAICDEGKLHGWGDGYLGNAKNNTPQLVSEDVRFNYVAAGQKHAAAVDEAGQIHTWGEGGSWFNGGGHLGHNSLSPEAKPKLVQAFREYGATAKQVSCGGQHTLVLTDDGEVLSFGVGEYGRLGTGSVDDALVPHSLETLANVDIIQAVCGSSHSLALGADGSVYSWGKNDHGQLGNSDSNMDIYSMEEYPQLIPLLLPSSLGSNGSGSGSEDKVVQVAAGKARSAALTASGRIYTWGARLNHLPSLIDPALFDNLRAVKVACGGDSSRALTAVITEDGGLWTFGDGGSHMLGIPGLSGKQHTPKRVSEFIGRRVVDVVCGLGQHVVARVEIPNSGIDDNIHA